MDVGVGATPAAVQPPAAPVPRAPVPAAFRAVDATFVSAQQGWVLVTDPDGGHAQPLRTRDRGQHFGALPPIGAQVDQLRFADSNDGFASSNQAPLLRVTHDAGATWNAVPVPAPVLALEPGAGAVWLLTGQRDRPVQLLRIDPAGSTTAQVATVPAAGDVTLVVHGSHVYVLAELDQRGTDRPVLLSLQEGRLVQHDVPCRRDDFGIAGAASGDLDLAVVCASQPGAGEQLKSIVTTADGGSSWTRDPDRAPISGYVDSVAATQDGTFLTGGRAVVSVTRDAGRSWQTAYAGSGGAGGPLAVGFTDDQHGFAVGELSDSATGLTLSDDGGRSWREVLRRLPAGVFAR